MIKIKTIKIEVTQYDRKPGQQKKRTRSKNENGLAVHNDKKGVIDVTGEHGNQRAFIIIAPLLFSHKRREGER